MSVTGRLNLVLNRLFYLLFKKHLPIAYIYIPDMYRTHVQSCSLAVLRVARTVGVLLVVYVTHTNYYA